MLTILIRSCISQLSMYITSTGENLYSPNTLSKNSKMGLFHVDYLNQILHFATEYPQQEFRRTSLQS